jgi:hypothetical protein
VLGTIPSGSGDSPFRSNNILGVVVLSDSVLLATAAGVYLGRYSEGLTRWDDVTGALPTSNVERLVSDGHTAFAFSSDAAWLAPWSLSAGQWVARGGVPGVRTIDADPGSMFLMAGAGVFRWNGTGYDAVPAAPLSGPPRRTWVRPATAPDGQLYLVKADSLFAQGMGGAAWDTVVTVQSVGNNIYNLALEGPRLYVNTYSEGIGRYENGAWTRWLTPRTCFAPGCDADTTFYNPSFAFALLVDRRGTKWFSTWGSTDNSLQPGAIERLDDSVSPPSFTRYSQPIALGIPWNDAVPNQVRHTFAVAATLDSAGGHWFGMDSPERENQDFSAIGIDYYDSSGVFVRNFGVDGSGINGPRSKRVLALATTRDKWVWVGTNLQGIQKVNPADTLHVFRNVDLTQLDVRGIAPAGDTVWVLTTSAVLAYALQGTPAQKFVTTPIPANPSDDAGHPLEIATDGTVWAGTTSGIQVYRRDGTKLTSYTVDNSPIASNDVRAIVCDRARGVMWIGTSGGLNRFDLRYVPPPPPAIPRLDARVYPNPVRLTGLGIDLRLTGNATTYDGAIYDLHGRTIAVISGATNGAPVWNGRDLSGNLVGAGVYFLQLHAGGHTGVERIVLLR